MKPTSDTSHFSGAKAQGSVPIRRRNPTKGRVRENSTSARVKRTSDIPVMVEGQGIQGNRHMAPSSHSMGASVSG